MSLSQQQAINYIECARELSELSSLLLQQATNNKKRLTKKIEAKTGDALYWLWLVATEYLSEEKIKKQISEYEEGAV